MTTKTSTRKPSKTAAKAPAPKPQPKAAQSPKAPSKPASTDPAVDVTYTVGSKHLWPPIKDGALLIAATLPGVTVTPVGARRVLVVSGGTAASRKAAAATLDAYVNGAEPALREHDASRPDVIKEMNRTKEGRRQRLAEERQFFIALAEQRAASATAKPKRRGAAKEVA